MRVCSPGSSLSWYGRGPPRPGLRPLPARQLAHPFSSHAVRRPRPDVVLTAEAVLSPSKAQAFSRKGREVNNAWAPSLKAAIRALRIFFLLCLSFQGRCGRLGESQGSSELTPSMGIEFNIPITQLCLANEKSKAGSPRLRGLARWAGQASEALPWTRLRRSRSGSGRDATPPARGGAGPPGGRDPLTVAARGGSGEGRGGHGSMAAPGPPWRQPLRGQAQRAGCLLSSSRPPARKQGACRAARQKGCLRSTVDKDEFS